MATPATSRPRDSGRPCGCDPAAGHVCSQHAAHVDESETAIVESCQGHELIKFIVSGPDQDGNFAISLCGVASSRGPMTVTQIIGRFMAEDLVNELARRLAERA